ALHVRDLRSGADRRLVASITPAASGFTNQDQLPDYAFTPDGKSLFLTVNGKINRVDVATGASSVVPMHVRVSMEVAQPIRVEGRIPDVDLRPRILRWPSLSPDARHVVVSALGKLYAADIAPALASSQGNCNAGQGPAAQAGTLASSSAPAATAHRLTKSDDREYTPSYSPDGKWIAYTTWSDDKLGDVMLIPSSCVSQVASCTPRRVTTVAGRYANPVWSRDGKKLAFSRGGGIEQRGGQPESETYFDLLWVNAEGGEPQYVTS